MAQKEGIKIYGTLVSAMKDHKLAYADEIAANVSGLEGTNVKEALEELSTKIGDQNNSNNDNQDTSSESTAFVYLDDDNKRVVLVLSKQPNTKELYSPTDSSVVITLATKHYDFMVNGNMLSGGAIVTATGGFKVRRLTDSDSVTTLSLDAAEINQGSGVVVRVLPPAGSYNNKRTGVVTVTSDDEEFETRRISVQYGDDIPSSDLHPFTPGGNSSTIVTPDTEVTN